MIEWHPHTGEAFEIKFKLKKCPNRKQSRFLEDFPCEECGVYESHGLVGEQVRTRRPDLDAPKVDA